MPIHPCRLRGEDCRRLESTTATCILGQNGSSMLRCTSDHLFSIQLPHRPRHPPAMDEFPFFARVMLLGTCFEGGCLEAEQEQLWHVHALVASYRRLEHHRQAIRLLSTLPSTTCRGQEWSITIVWLARHGRQIQWIPSQAGKAANAPALLHCCFSPSLPDRVRR